MILVTHARLTEVRATRTVITALEQASQHLGITAVITALEKASQHPLMYHLSAICVLGSLPYHHDIIWQPVLKGFNTHTHTHTHT